MCKDFDAAVEQAVHNLKQLGGNISKMKIPCRYKGAFLALTDKRGIRFKEETLQKLEVIARTNSDVLLPVLDRKKSGVEVAYMLAVAFSSDKERAMVLEELEEQNQTPNTLNVSKAILTVRERMERAR